MRQLVIALAVPIFIVTNTNDSGFGSLRDAMESLSRQCIESSCEIQFAIPPPVPESGWFTIRPQSPLPSIDAKTLVVDGASQTAVTGDTNPNGPEIEINGSDVVTLRYGIMRIDVIPTININQKGVIPVRIFVLVVAAAGVACAAMTLLLVAARA